MIGFDLSFRLSLKWRLHRFVLAFLELGGDNGCLRVCRLGDLLGFLEFLDESLEFDLKALDFRGVQGGQERPEVELGVPYIVDEAVAELGKRGDKPPVLFAKKLKLPKDGDLNKTERERIKQASRDLLEGVLAIIAPLDRWTEKEQTQAEVESFILDQVYLSLPEPPYTADDKAEVAQLVYRHIWQQSLRNQL